MRLKRRQPKDWHLYVILDRGVVSSDARLLQIAEDAIRGGADAIQLRYKTPSVSLFIHLARRTKRICDRYRIPFIVDDRLEVALAVGADGVHIGRSDICLRLARKLIGKDKIVGVSASDSKHVRDPLGGAANYIGFGPIFKTPVKSQIRPLGTKLIKRLAKLKLPVIFIGGINLKNVGLLAREGARRIAVIRAVARSRDPVKAARDLRGIIG